MSPARISVTQTLAWGEQASSARSGPLVVVVDVAVLFFFFQINPTPSVAITLTAITRTTSPPSDQHVRKGLALNMTQSPCAIIAERPIFLLCEIAGRQRGAYHIFYGFFSGGTSRPNATFESSGFSGKPLQSRRASTNTRIITSAGWMSGFLRQPLCAHYCLFTGWK